MNTDTTLTGKDIKSDYYRGIKAKTLGEKQQQVLDAALLAHAQGQRDFTNNELCVVMQGRLGRRVVPSDITSSIEALISSGLLAANYHHGRACSITGSTKVRTLFAVARQTSLGFAKASPATHAAANPHGTATASENRPGDPLATMRARLAAMKSTGQSA